MTIVILNDFAFVNGGAGQVAISSAIALAESGYNIVLFAAVGPVDEKLMGCKNLRVVCLNQYDILNDPKRHRAIIYGVWNRHSAKRLKEELLKLDKEKTIVHVHAYSKALSSSCIYVARKMGFKILFHLHDYGVACPNLGFYNYQKQTICKRIPLSMRCLVSNCDSRTYAHKIWRVIRQYIQKYVAGIPGEIKKFAAVSEFSYSILKEILPQNSNIYFIPNPINIEKTYPSHPENNSYITFIGRMTPEKNPVLLARAVEGLNLPALFIGEGPCEEEIKKSYSKARITGWVSSEEVEKLLRKTRVVVLTSMCYETQGMAVLEAVAKGVPVVVPDTCAASEFIINNRTGLIFQSNNIRDLEKKLLMLCEDQLVRDLGRNAYKEFWKNPMSMDHYISNIVKVYSDILLTEQC